jgi:hypothetical protein
MFTRSATQRPQGILQALGQGDITLSAKHDMGMFKSTIDHAEMIEPVIKRLAGDTDVDIAHVGKIGQPHLTRFMDLAEHNFLIRAVKCSPASDPPFHRSPHSLPKLGVPQQHLAKNGDRPQPRRRLHHRNNLIIPNGT